MNGKRQGIILAVAVSGLFAHCAGAESLVEQHLATIQRLHLEVLVPRYEPLPGSSPERLEESLKERAAQILEHHDIRSVESSQQELVLEVQLARSASDDRMVALLVILELQEAAVLTREWAPGSSHDPLIVTSWREVLLGVTSSDDVVNQVYELVDIGTTHFAEEVKQARAGGQEGRAARDAAP